MVNRILKDIMHLLIDEKGFFLEEFASTEEDFSFYLYTPIRNGVLAVIFSSLGREEDNLLAFRSHAKIHNIPAYVVNIVFTQGHGVLPKAPQAQYSEVYVNGEGEFFGHDDVTRSVLAKPLPKPRPRAALKDMALTLGILAMNVAVYVYTALKSQSLTIDLLVLLTTGAKINELILRGQYWRLLTSAFLHADFLHLLFNMYALVVLGRFVETALGKGRFLGVYLFSTLTGGIMSFLFTPNVSVGASGAIFGLLGAIFMMALFGENKTVRSLLPRVLAVMGLNLLLGMSSSGIDNFGHVGGLLGGIFLTGIFLLLAKIRRRGEEEPPQL